MKKLCLLGMSTGFACLINAQPSFQNALEAGISLPIHANALNGTHTAQAIHFGNHFDYMLGEGSVQFGLGAYVGYLNALSTNDDYAKNGQAIAEKYRFSSSALSFRSSAFRSTQVLLGPVFSAGKNKYAVELWAKAGYGFNDPSQYAVIDRENGVVNNIYINQAGDNRNGLAYRFGAGVKYAISDYTSFGINASYFNTRTDQVNYNYDREKGISPLYYTANNAFIQASAALQFTFPGSKRKIVREVDALQPADTSAPMARGINKTKSNVKNNIQSPSPDAENDNDNSRLFFTPEQVDVRAANAGSDASLQATNNYLTGFAYRTAQGNMIGQCGAAAMPGEPIPGIDVRLSSLQGTGNVLTARTNRDGSFAFTDIEPGSYTAQIGDDKRVVTIAGGGSGRYKVLDIEAPSSCGADVQHYVIAANDKLYVEVLLAQFSNTPASRDAATGMATGKRMHKPMLVGGMDFDIDPSDIITEDGKTYAAVKGGRDAGSGMASGRRILVTGDLDGDGVPENAQVSLRDVAASTASGQRIRKPFLTSNGLTGTDPQDPEAGKLMQKPVSVTVVEEENDELTERDVATGMASGKRLHRPFVTRVYTESGEAEQVAPRDAATGMASGRRLASKPEEPYSPWDNDVSEGVVSNPLYEGSGTPGSNPLHQSGRLTVPGSDGKLHEVFIPASLSLPDQLAVGNTYHLAAGNWIFPGGAQKGIQEKGVRKSAGAPRAENIVTSESNLKSGAMLKQIKRVNCNGGRCSVEAIIERNGVTYEAVISGILKTKHDTVKNSISNIR